MHIDDNIPAAICLDLLFTKPYRRNKYNYKQFLECYKNILYIKPDLITFVQT